MITIRYPNAELEASRIGLGLMRIADLSEERLRSLLETALACGVNFFDNAEDYRTETRHTEECFGRALRDMRLERDKLLIQSKIGYSYFPVTDVRYIDPSGARGKVKHIDNSAQRIIEGAEGSLKRIGTDYLDVLLLHRPDALMEPEEVASAFDRLHQQGKVRYFGVSNFAPSTVALLQRSLSAPLVANQLQFGILNSEMVDAGFNCNRLLERPLDHGRGVLDDMRLMGLVVQTWGSFSYGFFNGPLLAGDACPRLNEKLAEYAEAKRSTPTAVYTAWLMRHPARMQVMAGTTNPQRLKEICAGSDMELSRGEWYEIYLSAGKTIY